MEQITLNRQQLYELVWTTPLSKLAKQYHISDYGLRKICKKMNIPLPNLGHWQKLQYLKPVLKIDLPTNYSGRDEVTLNAIDEKDEVKKREVSIKTSLIKEIESNKELPMRVPTKLKNPDSLIVQAQDDLKGDNHNYWSRNGLIQTKSGFIDMKVTPRNFSRALRFMDTLIKLLRARGHEVIVNSDKTYAVIFGEKIVIRLQEKLRFEEKDNNYGWKSREYFPTGILTFRIWKHFIFHQKTWSDGKITIENQLPKILAGLEMMALTEREQRIEREKQWAIEREEQRILDEIKMNEEQDIANFKKVLKKSKKWHKSEILRAYITEVEVRAIQKGELTEDLKNWLIWAREKIDYYDPLVNKIED